MLQNLPTEVLDDIFALLSAYSLIQCSKVSRLLRALAISSGRARVYSTFGAGVFRYIFEVGQPAENAAGQAVELLRDAVCELLGVAAPPKVIFACDWPYSYRITDSCFIQLTAVGTLLEMRTNEVIEGVQTHCHGHIRVKTTSYEAVGDQQLFIINEFATLQSRLVAKSGEDHTIVFERILVDLMHLVKMTEDLRKCSSIILTGIRHVRA
ncbi:hypothetical protein PYCC9005_001920 [Savitreella phatthalungensis]